jgi:hypothetical protein
VRPSVVAQVLHRKARRTDGSLRADAALVAADAALSALTGAPPPFEPWDRLAGRSGPVIVIALPGDGPVARAAYDRLSVIAGAPEKVRLADGPPASGPGDSRSLVILILRPNWTADGLDPDPELEWRALAEKGWPQPSLTLVDLLEPRIENEAWRADEILASRSLEAASVAARWILASRARGAPADGREVAGRRGLTPEGIDWVRLAVPR